MLVSLALLSEDGLFKARILRDNRRRLVKFLGNLTEEIETLELADKANSDREECVDSEEGFSIREDMTDFGSMVPFVLQNPNPPLTSVFVTQKVRRRIKCEGLDFTKYGVGTTDYVERERCQKLIRPEKITCFEI